MGDSRESDWLIPAAIMTAGAGAVAFVMMRATGFAGAPPFFDLFPRWMIWMTLCLFIGLFGVVGQMLLRRQERPAAHLILWLRASRTRIAFAVLGTALAGLNLLTYMWLKPQLDYVAPFWADDPLARIDAAILGSDGWRLLGMLNTELVAMTYTPLWFMSLMPALLYIFWSAPSRNRTAAIVSYFLLWSVFGPVGQYLVSAAGPIFYERLQLGARFADFQPTEFVTRISGYLWQAYADKALVTGAGISAMPSLHIATVTWATLSFAALRSPFTLPVGLFALYMWVASVALGWHYAVDGVVGGALAIAAFYLARLAARSAGKLHPMDAVPA